MNERPPRPVVVVSARREHVFGIPYMRGLGARLTGFTVWCWACERYRMDHTRYPEAIECGDRHARNCPHVPDWFAALETP